MCGRQPGHWSDRPGCLKQALGEDDGYCPKLLQEDRLFYWDLCIQRIFVEKREKSAQMFWRVIQAALANCLLTLGGGNGGVLLFRRQTPKGRGPKAPEVHHLGSSSIRDVLLVGASVAAWFSYDFSLRRKLQKSYLEMRVVDAVINNQEVLGGWQSPGCLSLFLAVGQGPTFCTPVNSQNKSL